MTLSTTQILSSLKDYSQCNDELVVEIKCTILEPFQPDLSRIQAGQRIVKPTRAEFKAMTTKLAPLAMRIVNQSIESLRDLKQKETNKKETLTESSRKTAIRCLIDSASYSIAGLKHMSASTTLKPLDIEKTMSNLICKIVDLGEYTRALDELTKLRSSLANTINISTENVRTQSISTTTATKAGMSPVKPSKGNLSASSSPRRGFLTESPNRLSDVEMASSPWEDSMLQKYGDLFTLSLDTTINDTTTVLLVLAYQMNAIRSWTDVADSSLVPHLPKLLDRSGNYLDWCRHLMTLDPTLARKQFGSLHRQLCKAASKAPLSGRFILFHIYLCLCLSWKFSLINCPIDIGSGKSFALQAMGMVALRHTDTVPIKSLCNRMVQIGVSYERLPGRCMFLKQ
ncbi:hypothetical protein BDB00DRAFT_774413 [Zychaea mexicana]|uniref:uncharacterized protein n=1 Tax=Zychaea mexicana TaxID=64656 RepID=UPI0022FEC3C5|nr:uncharacterized protein BDB00DRAFT_774413 [Zychaea mexicana]KAI9484689.1 hypothetical protein BDB00DRAFT_774413 [Zychaea mexicana]